MSKHGDNREQRSEIRDAAREGKSAGEAGVSTGGSKQIGSGTDNDEKVHAEKGKS